MRKSELMVSKVVSATVIAILLFISGWVHPEVDTEEITEPDVDLRALASSLEWEFTILPKRLPERRTLATSGNGTSADFAVVHSFRSVEPYGDKGPRGFTYLRFELISFQFSDKETAKAALDEIFPLSDTSAYGSRCFGGGYWIQFDRWIYELEVPCLFSQANYDRLISTLHKEMGLPEESVVRTIKCKCGGAWEASSLAQ